MNEKGEVFTYEYTAKQQKEIREIREKYQQKSNEISKMDKLRRLDASVTKKGICAYPLYIHITRKERERLAPEILKLTDELLK